jgi:hypothetical protein
MVAVAITLMGSGVSQQRPQKTTDQPIVQRGFEVLPLPKRTS